MYKMQVRTTDYGLDCAASGLRTTIHSNALSQSWLMISWRALAMKSNATGLTASPTHAYPAWETSDAFLLPYD